MPTKKLLLATALFTAPAAMAGPAEPDTTRVVTNSKRASMTPALEVTRVVTNSKGPTCTYVAEASERMAPEVRFVDATEVLKREDYTWTNGSLCFNNGVGGQREVSLLFAAEDTRRAAPAGPAEPDVDGADAKSKRKQRKARRKNS